MNTSSPLQPPAVQTDSSVHSLMCETLSILFHLSSLFLINMAATAFKRTFCDLSGIFMSPSLSQYLIISSSAPTTSQCTCKCHYPHFTENELKHGMTKALVKCFRSQSHKMTGQILSSSLVHPVFPFTKAIWVAVACAAKIQAVHSNHP